MLTARYKVLLKTLPSGDILNGLAARESVGFLQEKQIARPALKCVMHEYIRMNSKEIFRKKVRSSEEFCNKRLNKYFPNNMYFRS